MKRNEIIGTIVVVVLAAFVIWRVATSRHDVAVEPITTVGPSSSASATPTVSGSPTPGSTSSPGVAGSVTQGSGTLAVTGQVVQSSALDQLTTPAVWSPPPGTIALRWSGNGGSLTIAGDSFTNRVTTSSSLSLSFSVRVDGIARTFRSASGECAITISEALPTQMSGVYQCSQVSSENGTLVVDAQGTFQASG
jgi:hypothetical protein